MKLSFKNILPILLIFTLLILFAGCTTPSEEQPGYTPGTITGIIAAPCCLTSDDPVTEPCCVSPEYWCYYCQKTWKLQKGIEVVLTYGKVKVATVYTNEDGEFTFTNVDPGKNYVVTAYCPDFADNRPLVKDVALQLIEGGSFDTNITDLVSTSLGLVVDFLVYFTDWGPEDISLDAVLADRPEFPHFSKFKALVYEVRRVVENCELNLLTDDDVLYATCRAAEEISGLVIGCGAGFTPPPGPGPTPTPGECDGNTLPDITDVKLETISIFNIDPNLVADIHLIVGTPYEFCVTATDTDNVLPQPLTYYLTIDGVDYYSIGNSNCLTITPEAGDIGTHEVSVNVYDGCGKKTWGPVKVVVCPPFAEPSLVINIMEPPKGKSRSIPLEFCMDKCATITSVTVYYNCTPPGFSEITDLTDTRLAWTIPAGIIFTKTTNGGTVCLDGGLSGTPGTYKIDVTYTDPCKKIVSGSVEVTFKDCNCPPPVPYAGPDQCIQLNCESEVLVNFNGSGSSGTGLTYDWDFGDPNDFTAGTGATTAHTYTAAGSYTVTLTVTDSCGNSNADEMKLKIHSSCGDLPDQLTISYSSVSTSYYLKVKFSDGSGDILSDTQYNGWCAHNGLEGIPIEHDVLNAYCTLELDTYWNKINWIINNRTGYDRMQVQNAIWHYIHGTSVTGGALTLVTAADSHGSFCPGIGQKYVILLTFEAIGFYDDLYKCPPSPHEQNIMIEVLREDHCLALAD